MGVADDIASPGRARLRALLVEDSPDDEVLILRQLRNVSPEIEHVRVQDGDSLRRELARVAWDIVVSDFVLPASFSGLDSIRIVREDRRDIPIIIVSGTIGEDVAVEAVRTGADDYVMKTNLDRLPYAVERALRDRTDRLAREHERRGLARQLEEALRMEALGRLAGGIAHDFNNLLTAINGYADLIALELPPDSTLREEVLEIRRAGARGAELIQQLLAFGRRQALHPQPVELGAVLAGLHPLLARLVSEAVDVTIEVAEGTPRILVDRNQFEQAVVNLVANARDAMPEGGTVRIAARAAEDGAQTAAGDAILEIVDTGPGIDPSIRPMLFTPFFTTKPAGKGTGLGLASVHGFVTQSGGSIDVGAGPEGGARFTIRLPATQAAASVAAPAEAVDPGAAGRAELVLLVEDDDTVRSLVRTFLERHGYRVLPVGHPLDVDRALAGAGEQPAALVSDVVMPGLDGRRLAANLRSRYPHLAVVLMSGYALGTGALPLEGADALTAVEGGQFVQKPFTAPELAVAVRRALDTPRG